MQHRPLAPCMTVDNPAFKFLVGLQSFDYMNGCASECLACLARQPLASDQLRGDLNLPGHLKSSKLKLTRLLSLLFCFPRSLTSRYVTAAQVACVQWTWKTVCEGVHK